ncbi:hypothetical protein [Corynebacterium tapiri]|uniref:Uncharacterized protein n=1 Tax=Corynebacterium tapiri TaxID=1448266 RepID=A0A5C4U7D3_9CORY|nr:hypothetical protein [Corynebacterium tapiri]TNM00383.1 hypothetical protein FHE74_00050 [Corynebacterium tapiri]
MSNIEKKGHAHNPAWPVNVPEGFHAVSETVSRTAGAASPYGDDLELPLPADQLGYVHPYTRINR